MALQTQMNADWSKHGPCCPICEMPLENLDWKLGLGYCARGRIWCKFDPKYFEKTKKLKLNALGQLEMVGDWKVQLKGKHG
jgi:hypothetical protein